MQTKEDLVEDMYMRRSADNCSSIVSYRDSVDQYLQDNLQEVRHARIRENLLLSEEERDRIIKKQTLIDSAMSNRSFGSYRPSSKFKWQVVQDSLPLKYHAVRIVECVISRMTAKPQINLKFTAV